MLAAAVVVALSALGAMAVVPPISAVRCPVGWLHYEPEDTCYKVWPTSDWNTTTKVRLPYHEAVEFCALHDAVVPIVVNASQFDFILDLMGRTSGRAVWIGIRNDPANRLAQQVWRTPAGRDFDEHFRWDKKRKMPSVEDCTAIHARGDESKRIVGGNNKQITVDCWEKLGVVCQKQRVPVAINGVNNSASGPVYHVWGKHLKLVFIGRRIPPHTRVTIQTTTEDYFATAPPGFQTNCTDIQSLTAERVSLTLNVSLQTIPHHVLCNGTCDMATVELPASTPFVRGARYSFCFFVPIPFTAPKHRREYSANLLPNVYLETVQAHDEYLRDVCTRHEHSVDLFWNAAGHDDTNRDPVHPWYFNARHEYGPAVPQSPVP